MYCNYLNFTHTNLVSLKKYCRYRDSIFATLHQGFPNTIWCYPTNRPATWRKVNKWRPIEWSATASKCHLRTEIMLESLMLMFSNKCSWPTDDNISTAYRRSKVWHYPKPTNSVTLQEEPHRHPVKTSVQQHHVNQGMVDYTNNDWTMQLKNILQPY